MVQGLGFRANYGAGLGFGVARWLARSGGLRKDVCEVIVFLISAYRLHRENEVSHSHVDDAS